MRGLHLAYNMQIQQPFGRWIDKLPCSNWFGSYADWLFLRNKFEGIQKVKSSNKRTYTQQASVLKFDLLPGNKINIIVMTMFFQLIYYYYYYFFFLITYLFYRSAVETDVTAKLPHLVMAHLLPVTER